MLSRGVKKDDGVNMQLATCPATECVMLLKGWNFDQQSLPSESAEK